MSKRKTFNDFIIEYVNKFGRLKYEFDESTYVNTHTPMRIICPKHGEFWRIPKNMMYYECTKCSYEKRGNNFRLKTCEFIEKARKVHGDKYDYSDSMYKGTKIPIKIICPIHGEFKQVPNDHLSGKGCPYCKESHLERKVKTILNYFNIEFIGQYTNEWLGRQSLDFYIPSLNLGIECQGKQHFGYGGWKKEFDKIYERDKKKYYLCKEGDIELLYVIDDNMYYSIPENIIYKNNIIKLKELKKCIRQKLL